MKIKNPVQTEAGDRGNFILVFILILLLGLILVGFVYLGLRSARKAEINDFQLGKSQVWDQATRAYNRLLFDSIPSISLYKGNLDSTSFLPIATRYLSSFPFLEKIELYNLKVSNEKKSTGISFRNLNFLPLKYVQYGRPSKSKEIQKFDPAIDLDNRSSGFITDCFEPLLGFSKRVAIYDSTRNLNTNETFHTYYQISDLKITYLSIPRVQEMTLFRNLMNNLDYPLSTKSRQNLVILKLNPFKLPTINIRPDLYQKILIKPLSFDSLSNNSDYYTTSIALPRAFSDYQLYFISSQNYLFKQATERFIPNFYLFLGIYLLLALIGFLVYRNLSVNNQLFKLQYDFINNFTHEFKTPVSIIKITGESLKSDGTQDAQELKVYGRILEEEADKLNNLMSRLLSLTQLENKVVRVHYEDLNLADFFDEIIEEYKLKYPDFHIHLSLDEISLVKSDKVLLNSIFSNLMDNAYKYSYPDKKVLYIKVSKSRKWIIYHFIDEGIGINESEIPFIFNKFYKIENEFNVQGSIGIGLAFSKQVINLMNGTISVRSKEGKGTEFQVKLPDLH